MSNRAGIHFLRRFRIQTRLLAAMLACSLIPVMLFGLYASNVYAETIHDKVSEYLSQSMTLLTRNLEMVLEPYSTYLSNLSASENMRDLLNAYEKGEEYSSQLGMFLRKGLSAFDVGTYLRDLQIYSAERTLIGSTGYESTSAVLNSDLLTRLDNTSGCYLCSGSNGTLILGRKLYHYAPTLRSKGYLLLFISAQLMTQEIFADLSFGEGAVTFFISADGTPYFPNETAYETELVSALQGSGDDRPIELRLDKKRYLMVVRKSNTYGCSFAVALPYTEIQGSMGGVLRTLTLVAIGLFILSFLVMLVVYASIMQPIRHMLNHCSGNLSALSQPINDQSPDELGILSRTIDSLIARLCEMAEQQKNSEKRKRELELEALQYQINPHFLFNTLNTFKWIADLNHVPALHSGIASLSALLKSTLLNKNDLQPLKDELRDLSHYFSIQRLRYANCFDVVYQIDESMLPVQVPRFILQPLAENAVVHGTDDSGKIMTITISAQPEENGLLRLTVQDDGVGFDADAKPVRERFSGIGIPNVDERIKMHYGTAYGVTVVSHPGEGTLCTILIPLPNEKPTDEK